MRNGIFGVMRGNRTAPRGRLAWATTFALLALALALATLAACNGSGPATGSATRSAGTSPAGPTTGLAASATAAASTATATPHNWAFSATVNEQFSAAYCTGKQPKGSICLSGSGAGQGSPVGQFTLTRTAVMLPGGSDSCGTSTMEGSLVTATSDTVNFRATGTFCRANQTATYTYTITGGSGKFAGATGSGTVTIPTPTTSTTDTQTWRGTLKYTGG